MSGASHSARTAVVVPAHDEAAVIERTLRSLLAGAATGEFDVIVVANGCSDDTAARARRLSPAVRTLEIAEASKTAALNAGIAAAESDAVLFLDADIVLDTDAARALRDAALEPGVDAAIGHMDTDLRGASAAVRAFHRIWNLQPYFDGGKFAAAFALSRSGLARLGAFPAVTADDEYVARRMRTVRSVAAARFLATPPQTLGALLAVRTRARRGTRELAATATPLARLGRLCAFAARVLGRPSLWAAVPVYLGVVLATRLRALRGTGAWERDETSRREMRAS